MYGWEKSRAFGVGWETGYTVSLIVTTWVREECLGSGVSVPAFQGPPWFYLLFRLWVTTIKKKIIFHI